MTAPGFPAAAEVDGFWSQDRIHAPRPLSPLAVEMITDTMAIGFTRAHAECGAPIDMHTRPFNHYLYSSLRPPADPAEQAERAERYGDLPLRLDGIGDRWEQEWKPALMASVAAGRVRDYATLSDTDLADELERQRDHMIDQWTIHGWVNFGVVAGARFVDFYTETFQPADPSEGYHLLQGHVTQTVRGSQALWELSRLIRTTPELTALFTEPTAVIAATLDRHHPGPSGADSGVLDTGEPDSREPVAGFAVRFRAFLDTFGWRSDAVYDVADLTWREDPSIPLDALRAYVTLDDSQDPEIAFARAVARREELLAAARARLADNQQQLALFDRYYEAGRHNLPLTEDHAFWIDQSGVANIRRFLLHVGRRLTDLGHLDSPSDVFYCTRSEIDATLRRERSGGEPALRAMAAQRRASVQAAAAVEAPRTLGTPPPPSGGGPIDPLLDAFVNRLSGRRPTQEARADLAVLAGHAASGGVVTGAARVVTSLAEAAKLNEGEILVCEMTLPPWVPLFAVAAAVVADTGGLMSHCAIVAREFGLPAVVGTQIGTRVIRDGMTITVNGDTGEIRLHDPSAAH